MPYFVRFLLGFAGIAARRLYLRPHDVQQNQANEWFVTFQGNATLKGDKNRIMSQLRSQLTEAISSALSLVPVRVIRGRPQFDRKRAERDGIEWKSEYDYQECERQLEAINPAMLLFAENVDLTQHHVNAFDNEHWALLMSLSLFTDTMDPSLGLLYNGSTNKSLSVWSGVKRIQNDILRLMSEKLNLITDHDTGFTKYIKEHKWVDSWSSCPYKVQAPIWRGASSGICMAHSDKEVFDVIYKQSKSDFENTFQHKVELPSFAGHAPQGGFTTYSFSPTYPCSELVPDMRDRIEAGRFSDWSRASHFACKDLPVDESSLPLSEKKTVELISNLGPALEKLSPRDFHTKPFCPIKDCPNSITEWDWQRCGPIWRQCKALENPEVNLKGRRFRDAGAIGIANLLMDNDFVTSIELIENQISDRGAEALARALEKNTAVASIDLRYNQIGDRGAEALARVLENNTAVTSIDFSYNQIGDRGAEALARALEKNTAVASIDLRYNQIGDRGAEALARALEKNTAVTSIKFIGNRIGDRGAGALARALENNTAVASIDLRYNQIGDRGAQALARALEDKLIM